MTVLENPGAVKVTYQFAKFFVSSPPDMSDCHSNSDNLIRFKETALPYSSSFSSFMVCSYNWALNGDINILSRVLFAVSGISEVSQ